jgi:quercetin dioxygenase-like cupin family protein
MRSSAAALLLLATATTSVSATDYNPPFPPFVTLGNETRLIYPDFPVELLVTEAETGGQFGMVVVYTKPGEGPGDNATIEYKLTETFYVLEGTFRFTVGDDIYEGGPGTIIINPPNVPHGFLNIGDGVGRLLTMYTPTDGTHGTAFFTLWADQAKRTPEWIAKRNAEYGIDRAD